MDEVVFNEFAQVRVTIDHSGHSPRLKLEDLRTSHVRLFDALELETIAWLPDEHLRALLDPSSDRWREQ